MTRTVPKRINLPFGYTVKIKHQDKKHPDMKGCYGCWSDSTRTIYLRKDLRGAHKIYIFLHELLHVIADFQHWCVTEGLGSKRIR